MAMRMRRQVYRDSRDGGGKIGTVIEIEAAQVILVRFPLTAMLADDHSRNSLENFARPHDWTRFQLLCRYCTLATSRSHTDDVFSGSVQIRKIAKRERCRNGDVRAR